MRQIRYFFALFLCIFISQLCSSFKISCIRKYFSWRCFLFISLRERAFRKNFQKFIPRAEMKIILLKAERESYVGNNNFAGTNLYIKNILSKHQMTLISHSLLVYCKNLKNIVLVASSAVIRSLKSATYRQCNKWR
uniref:Lipoprotein n=1 Tax=Strongyloides venezuelensis TaxID=75913 RepID=A0A0K0FTP7_STRVS